MGIGTPTLTIYVVTNKVKDDCLPCILAYIVRLTKKFIVCIKIWVVGWTSYEKSFKIKKTAQTTPGVAIKVLVSFFFHSVLSFCCHADVKNFLFEDSRIIKFRVYSIEKKWFDVPLRFRLWLNAQILNFLQLSYSTYCCITLFFQQKVFILRGLE